MGAVATAAVTVAVAAPEATVVEATAAATKEVAVAVVANANNPSNRGSTAKSAPRKVTPP